MKCLAIKQPFAYLIVSGRKTIEIRSWKTSYRGKLLIHASKVPDKPALKIFGIDKGSIELGKIIGRANLVGCKRYKNKSDFLKDKNLHLARDYKPSYQYGFVFEDPTRFKTPITLKGQLGIFNIRCGRQSY